MDDDDPMTDATEHEKRKYKGKGKSSIVLTAAEIERAARLMERNLHNEILLAELQSDRETNANQLAIVNVPASGGSINVSPTVTVAGPSAASPIIVDGPGPDTSAFSIPDSSEPMTAASPIIVDGPDTSTFSISDSSKPRTAPSNIAVDGPDTPTPTVSSLVCGLSKSSATNTPSSDAGIGDTGSATRESDMLTESEDRRVDLTPEAALAGADLLASGNVGEFDL